MEADEGLGGCRLSGDEGFLLKKSGVAEQIAWDIAGVSSIPG